MTSLAIHQKGNSSVFPLFRLFQKSLPEPNSKFFISHIFYFIHTFIIGTFTGILLITCCFTDSRAQGTWTEKAIFSGGGRRGAVGFSIGNKGYIGTGYSGVSYKTDFWEYDPILDSWTQKADFGGGARYHATGFSIGNMGYIGTGIINGTLQLQFTSTLPL